LKRKRSAPEAVKASQPAPQQAEQQPSADKFSPQLLKLSKKQKDKLCDRLIMNPNVHIAAEVLTELGFRNDEGALTYINGHIVWEVSEQDISQTWNYIFESKSDQEANPFFRSSASLHNAKSLKYLAKTDPETDGKPFWHHAHCFLFPFQNGVLKISQGKVPELVPYAEMEMLVEASSILPHVLILNEETLKEEYWMQSDFAELIQNQARDPKTHQVDNDLLLAIRMGLAKSCHLHFNSSDPCAVIFSEQAEQGMRNAGGTGKGILVEAITQMVGNRARIDGKSFDPAYAHALQAITAKTRLVWVDEVDDTEQVLNAFYTGLTEGFVINPKNKKPLIIPKERSPRVVFTTNSPGSGINDSDLRRRFDVPLTRWYHQGRQPIDDFDRELFGPEWSDDDWNRFHLCMAYACLEFLNRNYGFRRMKRCQKAQELLIRVAENEIDPDLQDHFQSSYGDSMAAKDTLEIISCEDLDKFRKAYPHNRSGVDGTRSYNNNLRKWLALKGWRLFEARHRVWRDGIQYQALDAAPELRPEPTYQATIQDLVPNDDDKTA